MMIQNQLQKNLVKATKILTDVFRNEGYIRTACKQAINIFEEIQFCFSRNEYFINLSEEGHELLDFIANNILEISQVINTFDSVSLIKKLSRIEIINNPFKSKSWKTLSKDYDIYESDDSNILLGGLFSVKITNRPKDKASFIFAKDGFGQDYFLHFDNFKDGDWKDWCQLSIGMILDIVAGDNGNEPKKAINAKEIYLKT